jgi:hypothetical protein
MPEFDPKTERHFPLLIVKYVEPGCTTELQIENCISGEVHRFTTTDNSTKDDELFEKMVLEAYRAAWAGL